MLNTDVPRKRKSMAYSIMPRRRISLAQDAFHGLTASPIFRRSTTLPDIDGYDEDQLEALLEKQDEDRESEDAALDRGRLWAFLEQPRLSIYSRVFQYALVSTTIAAVIVSIVQTTDVDPSWVRFLTGLEIYFTVFFTMELVLRASAAILENNSRYFFRWLTLIDIIATSPGYLDLIVYLMDQKYASTYQESSTDSLTRFVRILRVLRILRLARIASHSGTLRTVYESLHSMADSVYIFASVVSMASVFCAALVYVVEGEDKESPLNTLPISVWWSITTLTTTGYGDVVPQTVMGRIVGSFTMCLGVVTTSMCVALISLAFTEEFLKRNKEKRILETLNEINLRNESLPKIEALRSDWHNLSNQFIEYFDKMEMATTNLSRGSIVEDESYRFACNELNNICEALNRHVEFILDRHDMQAKEEDSEKGSPKMRRQNAMSQSTKSTENTYKPPSYSRRISSAFSSGDFPTTQAINIPWPTFGSYGFSEGSNSEASRGSRDTEE